MLLKHSEITPRVAEEIVEIFNAAGVPDDACINLGATHDQIAEIIADPWVQGVSLTGSQRAASAVGQIAGQHRKRTVFELGGSDAHIVLDTADIDSEVETVIQARMENTGQACDSNKRVILTEDIYDEFVSKLIDKVSELKPGDPLEDQDGTYAPLSSENAQRLLTDQVDQATEHGAKLHTWGTVGDQKGY